MGNQLIREQVFDVLFNYVKRADGIYTESDCATVRDEICLQIDQSQFTADEAEEHINQEVERRIAERMPSDEERHIAASEYEHKESMGYSEMDKLTGLYRNIDFEAGADWACSRLTNPGVNDSQKTEGGGE